jgi:hypothetical protein
MKIKHHHLLIIILLSAVILHGSWLRDPSEEKVENPVSFEILTKSIKVKNSQVSTATVKLFVMSGYHVNLYPPFTIKARTKKGTAKFKTDLLLDKKAVAAAEKLSIKGDSVYLDTKKSYTFNISTDSKAAAGKVPVEWIVTVFYCSDNDGVCFREVVKKEGEITLL